jgi:hypothetical protein
MDPAMPNRLLPFFTTILVLFLAHPLFALPDNAVIKSYGPIQTIVLRGSHEHMGHQYGEQLKAELKDALNILNDFYTRQHGIPYADLVKHADLLYQRFPLTYQRFIMGVAEGAGLSLDDAKVLNAMETLGELLKGTQALQKCAFIALPANKTTTHAPLIGRNYDFPPPYDQLSKYLTVTVLDEPNTVPTAFISIVGQIYCPSCVNAKGLFIELNNGMPSGGFEVDQGRESLLINLLQILQNSTQFEQLKKQLKARESDYSLIINTADQYQVGSYEYSSTLGLKTIFPAKQAIFASTNFYLNPGWTNIPKPTDALTWQGVSRRDHLLELANQSPRFDLAQFQKLMDKPLNEGGALMPSTIYQLILDQSDLSLYIKINHQGDTWQKIPLHKLFSSTLKN